MESSNGVLTVGNDSAYEQCLGGIGFLYITSREKNLSKDSVIIQK